jgi:hypothetical protein
MGNSVKLTVTSLIEKEAQCYERKNPMQKKADREAADKKSKQQTDYHRFIPQ